MGFYERGVASCLHWFVANNDIYTVHAGRESGTVDPVKYYNKCYGYYSHFSL